MPRTALLGATGAVGERVAPLLVDRAHQLVLVGRDQGRLEQLQEHLELQFERAVEIRTLDAGASSASLRAALDGVDLAVSALPVSDGVAARAFDVALAGAVHLVDTVDVQPYLVRAYDHHDRAFGTGTVVVPGVGWRTAVGDLLTAVAAERVLAPREVHVATVVPERGGLLRAASPGVLVGIASTLGAAFVAVEGGARVEELPGEERRLAWFPRPFGPRHAASVPGLEPLSVPRHQPQVQRVRSYLALSTPRAELLQAVANLARWEPARRHLARRLERGADRWRPGRPPARWAVVAEVEGEDGLARAWANGHDLAEATALLVAIVADAVAAGTATPGVIPPAHAGPPRDLLDALAAASSIRWSVSRPRD
ncbi:saccharopine dehydrogenase NADP-binding domain-containing protein [Nitriliruptor alkaliphilus]|uniref:saccharopine dehydrogenase NADP-binding domain-containing protein n=1 Tax=Nitriliruptor alkaliphilus TaxID=427918 RepID=UPI000697A4FE|nr:saccharopine dehydrogenase NADP-binding domain-containing protein [Nitriliruptor alkaliphilus]